MLVSLKEYELHYGPSKWKQFSEQWFDIELDVIPMLKLVVYDSQTNDRYVIRYNRTDSIMIYEYLPKSDFVEISLHLLESRGILC